MMSSRARRPSEAAAAGAQRVERGGWRAPRRSERICFPSRGGRVLYFSLFRAVSSRAVTNSLSPHAGLGGTCLGKGEHGGTGLVPRPCGPTPGSSLPPLCRAALALPRHPHQLASPIVSVEPAAAHSTDTQTALEPPPPAPVSSSPGGSSFLAGPGGAAPGKVLTCPG